MQFFKDLLFLTEKVGVAVILWTLIQEVSRSNLGQDTGYPDLYFVVLCKLCGLIPGCSLIGHTSCRILFHCIIHLIMSEVLILL